MRLRLLSIALITTFGSGFAQSGITWEPIQTIASGAYSNDHPRITLDGGEKPIVIWGHAGSKKAYFSRVSGATFTMPMALNPDSMPVFAANWAGPDITSKGDTVYAVFKRTPEDNYPAYIRTSVNGGQTFSAPVPIETIGTNLSRFPTVSVDANGNPVVAFMKFNSTFGDSRWVVARSNNMGAVFLPDTPASGFSGGLVCDCCPGSLVVSGNKLAMLYRDEKSNIRDIWAGVSTDNGNSFSTGMDVDGNNWMLMACPASGPDGVLINDTLYSIFMNGASGKELVYMNKSSVQNISSSVSTAITGNFAGLTRQNYPRMDANGTAVAMVWKQQFAGGSMVGMAFTNDIQKGMPMFNDTVKTGGYTGVMNTDVAVGANTVHVVWEDDSTQTVKYRKGTFSKTNTAVSESRNSELSLRIYPNPAGNILYVEAGNKQLSFGIYDLPGKEVGRVKTGEANDISLLTPGMYILKSDSGDIFVIRSFVKE